MISTAIQQLVNYGLDTGLILPDDEIYIRNQLLMTMQLDSFTEPEGEVCYTDLEAILKTLVDDAVARGVCEDNSTARDLFDTKLMGVLTPRPSIVRANFEERYETEGPEAATNWFYKFSQDTDYIRRYRIKRDLKWVTKTPYGDLDITINLSKPEKDPKAIAAAKLAPQSAYPKCQLCVDTSRHVLLQMAQGITLTETDNIVSEALLTTSNSAYSKTAGYEMVTADKEDGDLDGPFALAAYARNETTEAEVIWVNCGNMDNEAAYQVVPGNCTFLQGCAASLAGQVSTVLIDSKALEAAPISVSGSVSAVLGLTFIVILPAALLAVGAVVVVLRRRK